MSRTYDAFAAMTSAVAALELISLGVLQTLFVSTKINLLEKKENSIYGTYGRTTKT